MKVKLQLLIESSKSDGYPDGVIKDIEQHFAGRTEVEDTEFLVVLDRSQQKHQTPSPSPSHMVITSKNQIDDFDEGVLA